MYKLEEYIIKRKKEDGINEFDISKRFENTRTCVNYIFEYFNNYLETTPAEEKTILHEQKLDKYRNMLREYHPEIQEWLVDLYSSYGKYMHRYLLNYIDDTYFLMYTTEAEFRALSYNVYPKAIKRHKFLEGQSEMVYHFIKDYYRVKNTFNPYDMDFYICDSVNEWIHETFNKQGVNLYNLCIDWVEKFSDDINLWPKGHKIKGKFYDKRLEFQNIKVDERIFWDYDYKQKNNLFNLDMFYRNMPKKSFAKGRKQEFEIILMYCWLHRITRDNVYWNYYINSVEMSGIK